MMERKLLLLGLLRAQEMHGYQINELIDAHLGTSIQLKKPTVYKLLGAMVNDGWINYHEEQAGNYPIRRVYRITPEGEEAFLQLLRQSLASYKPVSYLGHIGIVYLDTLPGEEAIALLRQRREQIENLAQVIRTDEQHQGGFQLMLSYHLGQLTAELEWLDEVIGRLQHA
jgi:DNA-binding PadR family transcriptional regulator